MLLRDLGFIATLAFSEGRLERCRRVTCTVSSFMVHVNVPAQQNTFWRKHRKVINENAVVGLKWKAIGTTEQLDELVYFKFHRRLDV